MLDVDQVFAAVVGHVEVLEREADIDPSVVFVIRGRTGSRDFSADHDVRAFMKRQPTFFSVVVLVGVVLVSTACAAGEPPDSVTVDVPPTPSAPAPPDVSAAPEPEENTAAPSSPVTLYVSNQSFDDPSVGITITIDGSVAADQDFDVEGQHNWIEFDLDLTAGDHRLVAMADTGTELVVDFSTELDEPRWAVVSYWWYTEEGAANFTFDISDEPIGFA